ncbi:MAG TPA: DUF2125 domain-containing protein, partial [Acetobacteraceae bacterium]|nr:DUF2125 domain-containing protein [Acetobacteraceae bacterium]
MRLRRFGVSVLLLVVLLAAADYGVWRWGVWRLERGIGAWMAQMREAGWSVSAGHPQPGGWPLAAAVTLPDLFLSGGEADLPGGLTWSAERATVSLRLLAPRVLQIEPGGRQRVQLAAWADLPFTAETLRATLPLPAEPPTLDATAAALRIGAPSSLTAVQSFSLHLVLSAAATGFQAVASGITLPQLGPQLGSQSGQSWPLGAQVAAASVTGTITDGGTRPAETTDLAARATAWRDRGGRVDVQQFALRWGSLAVAGTARLHLDRALQPAGQGEARLAGYAPALDRMREAGILTAPTVAAAQAVLSLLAR